MKYYSSVTLTDDFEDPHHITVTAFCLLLNLQVVNGYFVHYFSPEGIPPVMKNVVFVIDVSGSMSGTKIQQTREAMETILDQLREGDTFNIVTFQSHINTWQTSQMVPVTPDTIKSAQAFARNLRANGGK